MRKVVVLVAACAAAQIGVAEANIIPVIGSIQAAVDAANPGDVIVVPPGTYHETVTVLKDNISITGPTTAIIDARNFANGIHVGAAHFSPGPSPVCPGTAVRNFAVTGLTVQNASQNGIFLSGVDGYSVVGGSYLNNGDYAVYPSCSENGRIAETFALGGEDTCLYVGNDVGVSLSGNRASGCTVGIQIVNSSQVSVKDNTVQGNSAGILAIVDPLNPRTGSDDVLIEGNVVENNNLPSESTEPGLQMIPSGTGIMNVGGDDFNIRDNTVTGNSTFGVAILSNPLAPQDPRIEPNPDDNQVLRNLVINNGFLPPPNFTIPGVDLFYDGSGRGNCFSQNIFGTAIPPNIEAAYPCAATMAPEPSTAALSGTALSLFMALLLSGRIRVSAARLVARKGRDVAPPTRPLAP